jgi:hypothetical protein
VNETLEYLQTFAQFPFALRRFLKHRLTLEDARRIVRDRMEHREENFLRLVETTVYGYPRSPYLPLLKMAGCELGDLKALVKQKGLEGALRVLRDQGVYVAFEEFKGRQPIVRNGLTIPVTARDFDNPLARRELRFQTGGSTGAASTVASNLDHIAARAPNRMLTLAAHGLSGAPTALWRGILPDRGLSLMFYGALIGNVPQQWFSPFGNRDSRSWLKYVLATHYPIWLMRLAGVPVPLPRYVKEDQAIVVARWAAETVKTHGRCLIRTGVSRGVRLALAARAEGIDLTGVTITGGGEPATPAKVSEMTRSGARFISNYGMSDVGQPGSGCANPLDGSDVHLFKDAIALFTHPYYVESFGVTVPAFNLTTLLPTTPKILLNLQSDDYGIVEERHCGCELESHGYTTHLREIRSYSKLTGEGVTLIGTEMLKILNEHLPARFGGSSLDYQLMEAEDAQGFTRLYLIISPRIDINDEQAVIDYMLQQLSASSPMADAARVPWQHANTFQIKRMEPIWTERGKLLPLHIPRRHAQSIPQETSQS